jgi:hypothetical protein
MLPIRVLSYYPSILLYVIPSFPIPNVSPKFCCHITVFCPLFGLDAQSRAECTWIIHIMVISRREHSLVVTLVCPPSHAVHNVKRTMGGKLLK